MDGYQAIYDGVRNHLNNCDIGAAVENAMRDCGLSHQVELAGYAVQLAANEQQRPSVIHRPALSKDGNMWCALLGENIQIGCVGFGETPAKAMAAFDKAWVTQ